MPRAVSSVLGVLALTALALVLAAVAGVAVLEAVPSLDAREPVALSASATVDPADGSVDLVLVHESGPPVDVREVEVRLSSGGVRLDHQPPVPFYGATGFASFPSGPFNPVADPRWAVGESAGLTVTGANAEPLVRRGSVRVEVYRGDRRIAAVETPVN